MIYRRELIKAMAAFTALPGCGGEIQLAEPPRTGKFLDGKFKGFTIGHVRGKSAPYFSSLRGTGANLARISFQFDRPANSFHFERTPSDIAELRRILEWAKDIGIKLVIVGTFPGVEEVTFWRNSALRDSFVECWDWFANTFGRDSALVGLDLMNEPNPPWPSGRLIEAQDNWRGLAEKAIAAIRAAHIDVPIVFESVAGGAPLGFRDLRPLQDKQVVYSFHFYTPHEITHQHVGPSWTRTIPYPAGSEWGLGQWDADLGVSAIDRRRLELEMRDVISFQRKYSVPIYVGEFSCVRWAPGGSAMRYIQDCIDIFRKHGWSWTYHEFRGWPGWDAEIISERRDELTRSSSTSAMKLVLDGIASR